MVYLAAKLDFLLISCKFYVKFLHETTFFLYLCTTNHNNKT